MKKEIVFLALMTLSMFLLTKAFSMEEENQDHHKPSFVKREPVEIKSTSEESAVTASAARAHSIKETSATDLETLYFWAVTQGDLSYISDPKFITLPRGSHSENVIGVNPPDADSPQYVLKKLINGSPHQREVSEREAQHLLAIMNDPMFVEWNEKQNLQSGIKLLVNIPLAIYVNKDGASSGFIVVLNGARGVPFHQLELDEPVLSGFAERLAELHYYTKRCHRDLGYPNIFYNPPTQTITLIDVVDLAIQIPLGQELEYTLGSPAYSSDYVEGDVSRVCSQLRGSSIFGVKEEQFKKNYTRAMLRLDPQRGSEALERFRKMWEVLLRGLAMVKNPFEGMAE